jgi:hypothetical protein
MAARCHADEAKITMPSPDGMRADHFASIQAHVEAGRAALRAKGDAHLATADALDSEAEQGDS